MTAFIKNLAQSVRPLAKKIAQVTLGRLPPSKARLSGRLAIHGGTPVRDIRLRPWPSTRDHNSVRWRQGVGADLRQVFVSGVEGVPQPLAKRFASQWADYCGVKHCLLLPHGTDALRLALAAVFDHDGLEYGGEILVPNISFIASATSVLDRRFSVGLVDVDAATLNLDPVRVEEAIVPGRTRGIMPVHLFGQPADMTALLAVANKHGLKIIEDSAQSHGGKHELGMTGSLGNAGAFSFQSHKNLTSGEGGALTTDDQAVFDRAYMLHDAGRSHVEHERWSHLTLGWNCRPTEYVAALLLDRFKTLEEEQERRSQSFSRLREMIQDLPFVQVLGTGPGVVRHGAHMFVMRYLPDHAGGLGIEEWLKLMGAEGAPVYRGYESTLNDQPALQKLALKRPEYVRKLDTPVSDAAIKNLAYIPHQVFLGTEADMDELAAIFHKAQSALAGLGGKPEVLRV